MLDKDYRETVVSDLLEQFRGQPNNMVLVESYATQLQEVYEALMSLLTMLDIDKCTGHQLDIIGEIAVLSRRDAWAALNAEYAGKALDDNLYRKLLKYKILLNTSDGTYRSLMKGIKMFWKQAVHYSEDPEYPATIILDLYAGEEGSIAPFDGVQPAKAAGIAIVWRCNAQTTIKVHGETQLHRYTMPPCNTLHCGTYPSMATVGWNTEAMVYTEASVAATQNDSNLCGVIPSKATIGDTVLSNIVVLNSVQGQTMTPPFSGDCNCGTTPEVTAIAMSL